MARATTRQVAEVSGVSISTVQRVLARSGAVSPTTRDRVLSAASDVGYSPGLRLGAIGLLVPDLEDPFFAAVAKGAQERAAELGHRLFLADSDEDPVLELEQCSILSRCTDGLILCSARSAQEDLLRSVPRGGTVTLYRTVASLPSICIDDAAAARQAVAHLAALGHRHIAWAGGPVWAHVGQRRRAGLARAAEEAGVRLSDLGAHPSSARGGYALADQAAASGATAVVTFNNLQAIGLVRRLADRGMRVPEDLSIIAFDGLELLHAADPLLTTLALPQRRLGRTAVDVLVERLTNADGNAADVELTAELVVRGSTAEAPSSPTEPPRS